MSILDFAPGGLRKTQEDFLLWLEQVYNKADVFVCNAPTAAGKSWMIITVARWVAARGESTAVLTPTIMLQDQYKAEFPQLPNLKGAANYICKKTKHKSCADVQKRCPGCPYEGTRRECKETSIAIYNPWSYLANKLSQYHTHLIVDEAHGAASIIRDLSTLVLKGSTDGVPTSVETLGDLAVWLETNLDELRSKLKTEDLDYRNQLKLTRLIDKREIILNDIKYCKNDFHLYAEKIRTSYGTTDYIIKVVPLTLRQLPPRLWPSHMKKIFLFSATIDKSDTEDLGLSQSRRVLEYKCPSPIPPKSRPFVFDPIANMKFTDRDVSFPILVSKIKQLAAQYPKDKGLVHMTYAMARLLQPLVQDDPRFLFHTRENKLEQYNTFRQSKEPLIFVASGMEEGVDLAFDHGKWQVIATIPYPNLMDTYVKAQMSKDSEWLCKTTSRIIQQQTGRICRDPKDYGITFMLDKRFATFYNTSIQYWPSWFSESIVWSKRSIDANA